MEIAATWLIRMLGLYLGIGLVFGIYFVARGAGRIDSSARETGWGFKLLILPGATALWPLLVLRLKNGQKQPPVESNAHRKAAGGW